MSDLEQYLASRGNGRPPRVIARSFWGFDPMWASLIGFTREGDRTWFLENYGEGDLVLIYGADGEYANPPDIGKVLGFIQVERRPIPNTDRMTDAARKWVQEKQVAHRWTYALPMKKAWRCVGGYELRRLAAQTFSITEGRQRGSRGVVLSDDEARQVLKLKVRPANVWLEPPVHGAEEPNAAPLFTFFMPSRALPPSGARTVDDGPRSIYLSKFRGQPALLLPRHPPAELWGKALVKVGLAKDAEDRLAGLNQGFPKASQQAGFFWEIGLVSPSQYPNYEAAVEIEDALKQALHQAPDAVARSIGGEFFLADWQKAGEIFRRLTIGKDQVIAGSSPRRRR